MIDARGDSLVERLLTACDDDKGQVANELLAAFGRGYPVANLRRLFRSEREDVVKTAAWVASELGEMAAPLLSDLRTLLRHPLPYVRGFAADAVLIAASPANGDAVADAIRLIDDDHAGVRWKAMNFLARASTNQLRASLPSLTDIRRASLVKWLLDVVSESRIDDIKDSIDDPDPTRRRFAASAAARVAGKSLLPLQAAGGSADDEIGSFAREWLDDMSPTL